MNGSVLITRAVLKNYKSIATCSVKLRSLIFLVGQNGSGKSNFLDALHFVADALRDSLDQALRVRGGFDEVRQRGARPADVFTVGVHFQLPGGATGSYELVIGAHPQGGALIQGETCRIAWRSPNGQPARETFFHLEQGELIRSNLPAPPASSPGRLYLVNASGYPDFRPLYEALSRMAFYSFSPAPIRELQVPTAGEWLARDGSNIASVWRHLARTHPDLKRRVEEYVGKVTPAITSIEGKTVGPKETLEFRQAAAGMGEPCPFLAANMSDGTLHALAVLVALFQPGNGSRHRIPLVGIEEPELALHPAAAGVLRESLNDASRATQVLVTSHSPDLLDDAAISPDSILAAVTEHGASRIGPLNGVCRSVLQDRLFTAGELLQLNQLEPEPAEGPREPVSRF